MNLNLIEVSEDKSDRFLLTCDTHAHKTAVLLKQLYLAEDLAKLFNGRDACILREERRSEVLRRHELRFMLCLLVVFCLCCRGRLDCVDVLEYEVDDVLGVGLG